MIEINLLPSEYRRRTGGLGVSKSMIVGVLGLVGLLVALGGISYYQDMRLSGIEADIAKVEAKTQQMREDIALVDRLVDVKTRILRRMSAIEQLDRDREAWVRNMEDIATVIPDFLWLSEFHQGEQQTSLNSKRNQPANPDSLADAKNKLTLQGFSYTISSLANFILNLQDSPRFSDVHLKYAKITELNERKVYDFMVACRLEPITEDTGGFEDAPAQGDMSQSEQAAQDDVYGIVVGEDE